MNAQVIEDVTLEMEVTLEALQREFSKVRTGRASTSLLDGIKVDYYGAPTPLNQLASLSAPEPRLLTIQPFDKNTLGDIEKAVYQSDLGLTPVNDGKIIRVPIPELTEERRKEFVKRIRRLAEDFRVSMRNHRRDANERLKKMQKDKEVAEDEARHTQDQVQKITNEYVGKLDQFLKAKEKELMEV